MTTLSVIRLFETSKEGIESFVNKTVEQVESGEVNPLELAVYLKTMEKCIEGIQAKIKDFALSEAGKYAEKKIAFHGAEIEKCSVRTEYDYTNTNDTVWIDMNTTVNELKEAMKKREMFLKSLTKPEEIINQTTGEVITINPPSKKSTEGIKITIK